MSAIEPSFRLVGRDDELSRLRAAMDTAIAGRVSAAFVRGESGVGKSRLLRETASAMRDAGFAVLSGICLDIGDASPLHLSLIHI